jgi:hypothetical protein
MSQSTTPLTYAIDAEHGVVHVLLSGSLTFASLCELDERMRADPKFQPQLSSFVDCRVLTEIPSTAEIRKLALDRLLEGAGHPMGRIAIVALTRLGMEYGAAWELFADSPKEDVQLFTSPEPARHWLGLPKGWQAAGFA